MTTIDLQAGITLLCLTLITPVAQGRLQILSVGKHLSLSAFDHLVSPAVRPMSSRRLSQQIG